MNESFSISLFKILGSVHDRSFLYSIFKVTTLSWISLALFLEYENTVKSANFKLLVNLILRKVCVLHLICNFVLEKSAIVLTNIWRRRSVVVFFIILSKFHWLRFFAAHVIVILLQIFFHYEFKAKLRSNFYHFVKDDKVLVHHLWSLVRISLSLLSYCLHQVKVVLKSERALVLAKGILWQHNFVKIILDRVIVLSFFSNSWDQLIWVDSSSHKKAACF